MLDIDPVGLDPGRETIETSSLRDGLQIDLVTHDVKKFFAMLLKRNSYVLEQLYSPLVVHTTPEHTELKAIAATCITRHRSHHYLGFAGAQWQRFEQERPPRVKPLLDTDRVLLTGIHLMRTGEVAADLTRLNSDFDLPYIPDLNQSQGGIHSEATWIGCGSHRGFGLVARKLGGPERSVLADADLALHRSEYERLRRALQDAREASTLPERPAGKAALDDLLVWLRLGSLPTHRSSDLSGQAELSPNRPFQRSHVARRD